VPDIIVGRVLREEEDNILTVLMEKVPQLLEVINYSAGCGRYVGSTP